MNTKLVLQNEYNIKYKHKVFKNKKTIIQILSDIKY